MHSWLKCKSDASRFDFQIKHQLQTIFFSSFCRNGHGLSLHCCCVVFKVQLLTLGYFPTPLNLSYWLYHLQLCSHQSFFWSLWRKHVMFSSCVSPRLPSVLICSFSTVMPPLYFLSHKRSLLNQALILLTAKGTVRDRWNCRNIVTWISRNQSDVLQVS